MSAHTLPSVPSATLPEARPAQNAYYPALDGLRAVAFLMVFELHYLHSYLPVSFGWAGVDIFFVLSGFLITGILYDTQDHPFRVRNFYIRRTLRIFPLYYAVFLLLFLASFVVHWNWNQLWLLWPAYLGNSAFLLPHPPFEVMQGTILSQRWPWLEINFGHFWSLCVEEQFYLVWPWVVFGVRNRQRLITICLAAIVLCPLARALADFYLPPSFIAAEVVSKAAPFRIDALLLGALIALLLRGPAARRLSISTPVGLLLIAFMFSLWGGITFLTNHLHADPLWLFSARISLADLISACIILMAIQNTSPLARILTIRPLRWLGRISYGAYVFHELPIHLIPNLLRPHFQNPGIPTAILAFLYTLLIASASYYGFESYFINLKDRWTRKRPAPQPTEA